MTAEYLFVFESPEASRLFVQRAAHYLKDIAFYRIDVNVYVIDGRDLPQREEIYRFARASGAVRVGDPAETMIG